MDSIPAVSPLNVLFVASECAPYAKTGGLGDVVAGLPKELTRLGNDVRIVIPLYTSVDRSRYDLTFLCSSCVHMGKGEEHWVGIYTTKLDGEVPVYLVDYSRYFDRPGIYDGVGGEYGDNAFRFALLCRAAMQLCKDLDFIPDVMHLHDWPTSLAAMFLKTWDRILSPLSTTASVLTIHNIGYQGIYHASAFPYFGVGWEYFSSDVLEDHGRLNLLKSGIHFADAITTVSPTHAQEILSPMGGQGLAPYLNRRHGDIFGILNGVDYEHWNPQTDRLIPANYRPEDLVGKAICKAELQKRLGLQVRSDLPLFGVVSRFVIQKGFGLLMPALARALNTMAIQFVVLGSGDGAIESFFRGLPSAYPGRAGSYIGFDNELSHLIEAGSDFFLMPSLYEPCGLNQSYSMKYGTLPIVRATGGLDDTVRNYEEMSGAGTGFKFWDISPGALYDTIGWAVSTWYDRPHHIAHLRQQAMAQEFSWSDSALEYLHVYRRAIRNRRTGAV